LSVSVESKPKKLLRKEITTAKWKELYSSKGNSREDERVQRAEKRDKDQHNTTPSRKELDANVREEAGIRKEELRQDWREFRELYKAAGVTNSDYREYQKEETKKARESERDAQEIRARTSLAEQLSSVRLANLLSDDNPKIKLVRNDGVTEQEINVTDAVRLYNFITSVKQRVADIAEWIEDFQIGPGVNIKIDLIPLKGTLEASWGFQEYEGDQRVFVAWSVKAKLELLQLSLEIVGGWRTAGMADALVSVKLDGGFKVDIVPFQHKTPDAVLSKPEIKVSSPLQAVGTVEGTAFWVFKVTGLIQRTLELKPDFKLPESDRGFSFELVGELGAFEGNLAVSGPFYGSTFKKYEISPRREEWFKLSFPTLAEGVASAEDLNVRAGDGSSASW